MERFDIQNLAKDREIKSRYRVLNVGTIPENLTLKDVRPAKPTQGPKLRSVEWQTPDGLIVTLKLAREDGSDKRQWAKISAVTTKNAKEEVKDEARNINSKTMGWEFWLGDDVIKLLNETPETLTKEKAAD